MPRIVPETESLSIEFKSDLAFAQEQEIIRAAIALANAEGGELYLGVETDGRITGLHTSRDQIDTLARVIAAGTFPSIDARLTILWEGVWRVGRIEIPKASSIVANAYNSTYQRRIGFDGRAESVSIRRDGPMSPAERDAEFDAAFDEELDVVELEGCEFLPSDVLALDRAAYNEARNNFTDRQRKQLVETVLDRFPHPIAHAFHCFDRGAENLSRKIGYLKDTWEAIINTLFALTLGELRAKRLKVVTAVVKQEFIQSWSLSERIVVIRETLRAAASELMIGSMINENVVGVLAELNRARNEQMAHFESLDDPRSRDLVSVLEPKVMGILRDLLWLENVRLFSDLGSGPTRDTRKIEEFTGHSTSRRIAHQYPFTDAQLDSLSALRVRTDEVLALSESAVISLSPMLILRDTPGHRFALARFSKKGNGEGANRTLIYESIGESTPFPLTRPELLADLDAIKCCFIKKGGET